MTSTYIPAEPRPSETPIWDALVAEHGYDPSEAQRAVVIPLHPHEEET